MIAVALKHMFAAGMDQRSILQAVSEMEAELSPKRSKGAERQARYEERKRQKASEIVRPDASDGNDAAPHVGERAQVDFPLSSSLRSEELPPEKPSVSTPKGSDKRGCRLPDDFAPDFAVAIDLGLSATDAARQADKFLDYWRAVPGAKGRKVDWPATWRNWCRTTSENQARGSHGQRPHHDAKFDARQANLARHERGADIASRQPRWEP